MNENDLMNEDIQNNNAYRATTNLNMAIENPQINMNSVVGVNIENVNSDVSLNNYNPVDNVNSSTLENGSFVNRMANSSMQNGTEFYQPMTQYEHVNNSQTQGYQFLSGDSVDKSDNTSSIDNNNDVNYEPIMKEKKRSNKKLQISREFKVIIFIALILFIFILLVPYIYDFLKQLELMAM